ncbi:MAG: PTS fructose-like transporter subunit IIB [Chloroflexi bacterium]|nr:PTS fructose-like transporter subunit IIB [Chloroflexota bacterium]
MKQVAAVVAGTGGAHTRLAAEALRKTGEVAGLKIAVEVQEPSGVKDVLPAQAIADADVVLLASDLSLDTSRFAGKTLYRTRTSEAIRHTQTVLDAALGNDGGVGTLARPAASSAPAVATVAAPAPAPARPPAPVAPLTNGSAPASAAAPAPAAQKRIVAITSCPTGIAHTFMAAEALQKAATRLGHIIKVETQGSVGAQNTLTAAEIAAADVVIIAADTKVDLSRFGGKPVAMASTKEAIHDGAAVVMSALSQPAPSAAASGPLAAGSLAETVEREKAQRSSQRTGPYKHLMTGVSYMLPVVVAGGLCIALAFAVGGIYAGDEQGTLGAALMQIGGKTAFGLIVAILSAFIAYSIADRPGIAPGLVGGMLAQSLGAGFLGGIVSGFLAGYFTQWLARSIKLPRNLEGLKPVLILPLISTLVVGLLMIYVIAPPVQVVLNALTGWLKAMQGANALLLGVLLGAMMAFDMGGPVNKASYTFAVGLLASQIYTPMAAVMAAGMTPPLGLALAAFLFKNRFDEEEREAEGAAAVLGLAFITEGAIPFAAKDPLRVLPSLMLGSAVAGGLSMLWGIQLLVPHGGVFSMLIPGAVTSPVLYLVAILAGSLVTTGALFILKRPLNANTQPATATAPAEAAVA